MILVLDKVVPVALCESIVRKLETAEFVGGSVTAGTLDETVKRNLQLPLHDPLARTISRDLARVLSECPDFVLAVRFKRMLPPRINRYDTGMFYNEHLDNALMAGQRGQPLRTDIALTICLNDDYEGGELVIGRDGIERRFKGERGDVIVYPASYIHAVTPVTSGRRLVAVGWVQSQVSDPARRQLLYDLEKSLRNLEEAGVSRELRLPLLQIRSQLVRRWSEP